MLIPIACHDCSQLGWRIQEPEDRLLKPWAMMLLGQRQGYRRRAYVKVPVQLVLADHLQPLHVVPVRRDKQVLGHH